MSNSSNPAPADSDTDADLRREAGAAALRLLARREHSERELHYKLTGRGYSETVVVQVVAGLREQGAQSDRRFSESYTLARFERGFGPLRVEAELRERGVDAALIEAALDDPGFDWTASACRQRRKRFGGTLPQAFAERARQMRFLQQRGFSGEQIRAALAAEADSAA